MPTTVAGHSIVRITSISHQDPHWELPHPGMGSCHNIRNKIARCCFVQNNFLLLKPNLQSKATSRLGPDSAIPSIPFPLHTPVTSRLVGPSVWMSLILHVFELSCAMIPVFNLVEADTKS